MAKVKTPKLTHKDAVWFRERFIAKDNECRELRKLVEAFADELQPGGLANRLLAQELRERLAKTRKR